MKKLGHQVMIFDGAMGSELVKAGISYACPEDLNITVKSAHIGVEVIMDGRIIGDNLTRSGKDEKWLKKQLAAMGRKDPKDIFLAVYRADEERLTLYPNK